MPFFITKLITRYKARFEDKVRLTTSKWDGISFYFTIGHPVWIHWEFQGDLARFAVGPFGFGIFTRDCEKYTIKMAMTLGKYIDFSSALVKEVKEKDTAVETLEANVQFLNDEIEKLRTAYVTAPDLGEEAGEASNSAFLHGQMDAAEAMKFFDDRIEALHDAARSCRGVSGDKAQIVLVKLIQDVAAVHSEYRIFHKENSVMKASKEIQRLRKFIMEMYSDIADLRTHEKDCPGNESCWCMNSGDLLRHMSKRVSEELILSIDSTSKS